MDKIGADFFYSLKTIQERLGVMSLPVQLPIGKENDFTGIIDLVEMKAYAYTGDKHENATERKIPSGMQSLAEE
jgi:elongation factor G